jgi:hypothetical protein
MSVSKHLVTCWQREGRVGISELLSIEQFVIFSVALQSNSGPDRLIFEVYKLDTHTHILWMSYLPVAEAATYARDHALSRIRIRDPSYQAAADLPP